MCILICMFSTGSVDAQQVHCWWAGSGITIDGNPAEWPQPFRYYDGATKLQFSLANDTANLYICLKLTDEQAESRLFKTGLNIWIDPKGKKKESMGIVFPIKSERNPGEAESHRYSSTDEMDPRVQHSNIGRLKQHVFMDQTTLRVKGFIGLPEQTLPLKNNVGIDVSFNWDTLDILTLEYKIPMILVLGHSLTAADTLKPVGVGFVEGAAEDHRNLEDKNENGMSNAGDVTNSGMNRGSSGMGGGGMGGGMNTPGMSGRGGGMGGGRGGGMSSSNFNAASQEQKVWSKIVLAYQ